MDPVALTTILVTLAKELGPLVLDLIKRGASHPSTPPEVATRVRDIIAATLPTEADEARLAMPEEYR